MLTQDDLKAIKALLDEKLKNHPTKMELQETLANQTKDFEQKLGQQTKDILQGVADSVADDLIPLLDKHDKRLERLEKHTNHPPAAVTG
jgi:hypothetical protein